MQAGLYIFILLALNLICAVFFQMFVEDSSMLNVPSVKCEDSATKTASDLKNDQLSPNNEEDRGIGLSDEEKHILGMY